MMDNVSCILKIFFFQVEMYIKGGFRIENSSTKNEMHRQFLET